MAYIAAWKLSYKLPVIDGINIELGKYRWCFCMNSGGSKWENLKQAILNWSTLSFRRFGHNIMFLPKAHWEGQTSNRRCIRICELWKCVQCTMDPAIIRALKYKFLVSFCLPDGSQSILKASSSSPILFLVNNCEVLPSSESQIAEHVSTL